MSSPGIGGASGGDTSSLQPRSAVSELNAPSRPCYGHASNVSFSSTTSPVRTLSECGSATEKTVSSGQGHTSVLA